jgi:hypothetical protein
MKRLYLLIPLALLGLFAVPYAAHLRHAAQDALARAATTAWQQADAEKERQAAELKARADADQRAAARLSAETQADEAKRAQWDADGRRIAADTASYRDTAAKLDAEVADLQSQLESSRARRAKLADDAFATAKAVELARIDKRNAELEIQRLTAMLARQAAGAELPPLPAP